MSGHLSGPGHPAALLQAADLPLQQDVVFLQLPDLLDELAYVLQIIQTRAQRVGTVVLRLHKTKGKENRRVAFIFWTEGESGGGGIRSH